MHIYDPSIWEMEAGSEVQSHHQPYIEFNFGMDYLKLIFIYI